MISGGVNFLLGQSVACTTFPMAKRRRTSTSKEGASAQAGPLLCSSMVDEADPV